MEEWYFHKDGRTVWILLGVSPVPDAAGWPRHFVAQIQDITAWEQANCRAGQEPHRLFAHDTPAPEPVLDGVPVIAQLGATRSWTGNWWLRPGN